MKSLIISLLIGAAIIWGSAAYTSGLENVSEQLVSDCEKIRGLIDDGDFEGAFACTGEMSFYLEKKRAVMDATGKHDEIDEIEMNLAELSAYTAGGSKSDALAKCASLEFLFKHLPKDFRLRIENIF